MKILNIFSGKLLLTGHCLESKCDVANAICKQEGLFRMLNVRLRCLTKPVKHYTVQGHLLNVVVSPNMSTPAWTSSVKPTEFHDGFILYVRVHGIAVVDDDASIKEIKCTFKKDPIIVDYFQGDQNTTDEAGNFPIFSSLSFEGKCKAVNSIIKEIGKSFLGKVGRGGSSDEKQVPDRQQAMKKKVIADHPETIQFSSAEKKNVQGKANHFRKICKLVNEMSIRDNKTTFEKSN